ncbi:MAG: cellobiose 2-epimerase [Roseivirga sp.]
MNRPFDLLQYEMGEALINILDYWRKNTPDHVHGGFYGRITHQNKVVQGASKGIILNTRILWSFSAAANHLNTQEHNSMEDRAFDYLRDHFLDKEHGGVFWELDYLGQPINKRKQVYAQAFAIYALAEYYLLTKKPEALSMAIGLFELIEKHSKDSEKSGYIEAFAHDWSPLEDMRLSHKDMNASKTMNTHLHILEAYTTLLKVYDNTALRASLKELVELFLYKFLSDKYHYDLFFDDDWQQISHTISYGHDIETAWLVMEAARAINDKALLEQSETMARKVIDTFLNEALDAEGAVINELDLNTGEKDTDRHWWPQVEAIIGLAFAYRMTGKLRYTEHAARIWHFVKQHLIDHKHGEWYFRVDAHGKVYTDEDKVSMWKAPYHSTRACIMLNRI